MKKLLIVICLAILALVAAPSAKAAGVYFKSRPYFKIPRPISFSNLGFYGNVKVGVNNKEVSWNQTITLAPNDFYKIGSWYRIDLKYSGKNYGSQAVTSHFTDTIYLSGYGVSQSQSHYGNLKSNEVYTQNISKWVPASMVADGTYTLKFNLDSSGRLIESNEADNVAYLYVNLQGFNTPDLSLAPTIYRPYSNQVLSNFPRYTYVQWSALEKAVTYEVEISCQLNSCKTSNYSNSGTSLNVLLLDDNDYQVRVRARYSNDQIGAWSAFTYFKYRAAASPTAPTCKDVKGGNVTFLVCQGYAAYHFWSETRIYANSYDDNGMQISTTNLTTPTTYLVKGQTYTMSVISNPTKYLNVTYLGYGAWGRALIKVDSNTSYTDSNDYKNSAR